MAIDKVLLLDLMRLVEPLRREKNLPQAHKSLGDLLYEAAMGIKPPHLGPFYQQHIQRIDLAMRARADEKALVNLVPALLIIIEELLHSEHAHEITTQMFEKLMQDMLARDARSSQAAQKAAKARHADSRQRQELIREIWATGKYSSRDVCAEQECADLGMSFSTARKALRNTPAPRTA